MSSSDRLLLILHVGFAIFTLGPLTAATMASPRQIRRGNVVVLRHLILTTRIYGLGALGIFLFGIFLAHGKFDRAWLSASMTLFIVAMVLLLIVDRDQQRAAHKLELAAKAATSGATGQGAGPVGGGAADTGDKSPVEAASSSAPDSPVMGSASAPEPTGDTPGTVTPTTDPGTAPGSATTPASGTATVADPEIAQVERGRIAALSGVVALIWLVILFLMVWYA